MALWAQHTKLIAVSGQRDALGAKFAEVPTMQANNPDHLLTLVGVEGEQVVTLTEVWTTAEAHQRATESSVVAAWARGMANMVAEPPTSERFSVIAGMED